MAFCVSGSMLLGCGYLDLCIAYCLFCSTGDSPSFQFSLQLSVYYYSINSVLVEEGALWALPPFFAEDFLWAILLLRPLTCLVFEGLLYYFEASETLELVCVIEFEFFSER